jgi:hypothetical protein
MKKIELNQKSVLKAHKEANPDGKKLLENLFGKEFFSRDVTERIHSWEDILEETGRPDVPVFNDVPEDLRPFFRGVYKNVVMVEAYNEGERMNIYNEDKYRHYPYFRCNGSPSAFAFYFSHFDHAAADAGSGSRLSFKNEKLSNYAGRKHLDIFREMLES